MFCFVKAVGGLRGVVVLVWSSELGGCESLLVLGFEMLVVM